MLIKFLDDYEQIILLCAKNNYTEKQAEEVLSALEIQRFLKQKQMPRTKELNQVIKAIYKTKSDDNEDDSDEDSGSGSYLWVAESGSCHACNELDGQVFDEEPERPHPNCKCEIREIDEKETNNRKEKHQKNINKRDEFIENLNEQTKFNNKKNEPKSEETPTGYCATYVNNALEKSGLKIRRQRSAFQHGEPLEDIDFKPFYIHDEEKQGKEWLKSYQPKKGDIIVIQPTQDGKHPDGHIAAYNDKNKQWVSDFKQSTVHGLKNQKLENLNYTIYRNPDWQDWKIDDN